MRNRKRLILAGVLTVIIGLIITFPARVAYQWFAPEALKLGGISGSIWRGAAAEGYAAGIYLTNVSWGFQPLALLTGKLAFATRSNVAPGVLDARVAVGVDGSLTMTDVSGSTSLIALAGALPLAGIEGDLSLQFERIVVEDGLPTEATGTVSVANLVSRYLSPTTLGDYRAQFQTTDSGISGAVEAVRGVLDLSGTIGLAPDRSYEFVGRVSTRPGAPASIEQQLRLLGSPDANGQREFRLEGRL